MVRRWSQQKHVGHAGTLDPLAAGVLPVCLGQATRLSHFITGDSKTYLAQIELGVSTDTYDAEGTVTQMTDPSSISRDQVQELLCAFTGTIMQRPPMYSAIKHRGKRLYNLARAGIEVERPARKVEVFRIELIEWDPPTFSIKVDCGKGTYIRSLAHDMGQSLVCGAHLKGLIRTSCGPFHLSDSLTLSQVEDSFQNDYWQDLLYPMDAMLEHWTAVIVSHDDELAISNGRPITVDCNKGDDYCRAYSADGRLLALLRSTQQNGLWQPDKVFCKQG